MTREENDARIRVLREKLDNATSPEERESIEKEMADLQKTEQKWIESETTERVEGKNRIVKWVGVILSGAGTILLTIFGYFYKGYREDKQMFFEETGSCRSFTWRTKKTPEIDRVEVKEVR